MLVPNSFTDFFNIFMLPTIILDKDFNIIHKFKYDLDLLNSSYVVEALSILKAKNFSINNFSINLIDNVQFTCIQFIHYGNKPMSVLIGPYVISDVSDDSNLISVTDETLSGVKKLYSFFISSHCTTDDSSKEKSPCVARAIEYIEENYVDDISIDDLCSTLNINKCYFCSIFKKETGLTFINYLNTYKINKSKELLHNPNMSLLEISHAVGFNNQSYYSTVFKKITSQTPLEYRDKISK